MQSKEKNEVYLITISLGLFLHLGSKDKPFFII